MSLPKNTLKTQLGPGVWEDTEGGIHFSIPDILEYLGLDKDNPVDIAIAEAVIRQMLQERGIEPILRKTWHD